MREDDFLIFEDNFNKVPKTEQYTLIKSQLNDHNCKNIIIPSELIQQMTTETKSYFIELKGDIIIALNKSEDFSKCMSFLTERFNASNEFKSGISFNVLLRESIKLINTMCEKLSEKEKSSNHHKNKKRPNHLH